MGKSKSPNKNHGNAGADTPNDTSLPRPGASAGWLSPLAIRETVESIAMAIVLAFLFRTFIAEAFVIPTGSMAITLMGRHKDVTCLKCGYRYRIGANIEVDEAGNQPTGWEVISGTCPNCRFTMDVGSGNVQQQRYPSYSGDRIAAGKATYDLSNPRRWDVAVFRFPLQARTNYIKRIAGLPEETLHIEYGDVWIKAPGAERTTIARKPPGKILAVMLPVYDNDYVLPELAARGVPPRWSAIEPTGGHGAWESSPGGKSFRIDGSAPGIAWLGYRHVVPRYDNWAFWTGVSLVQPPPPKPQLITDFNEYDTASVWYTGAPGDPRRSRRPTPLTQGLGQPPGSGGRGFNRVDLGAMGLNWVGDLITEFDWTAAQPAGELQVDLVKGGKHFLARLNLAQGKVALQIPGADALWARAAVDRPGTHRVRFAHVDQQLHLWIDGAVVAFERPATYELEQVDTRVPNQDDLQPVRIGVRGVAGEVSHLRIFRDIYYIAVKADGTRQGPPVTDFDPRRDDYPFVGSPFRPLTLDAIAQFFSDPRAWTVFTHRRSVEFALGKDQFFMLGDNSPMSGDSRLWSEKEFFVKRELLIGQALLLYWPHSWNHIPGTPIPFPFFPNFSRMGIVR